MWYCAPPWRDRVAQSTPAQTKVLSLTCIGFLKKFTAVNSGKQYDELSHFRGEVEIARQKFPKPVTHRA